MPTKLQQNRHRVAFVTTELGVGGAERCLTELAIGIDPNRYVTKVFALSAAPKSPRDLLVRQLDEAGVEVSFLGLSHASQFLSAVRRLRDQLADWSPDVIQSFLFHANIVSHFANRKGTSAAHFLGIRVADPRYMRSFVERRIARKASGVICVSEKVAAFCRDRGFPEARMHVIANGVNFSRFGRSDSVPDQKCLGFLGRLDPQKGAELLPEIAERIWQEVPDMSFAIAGDGPLRPQIEEWHARLQNPSRVEILGWVAAPSEFLAKIDCLIVPSAFEGMANVVLEAMASGIPIVAFDVEGMREAIGDKDHGQLVPQKDVAELSRQTVQFLEDHDKAAEVGQSNRLRVEAEFGQQAAIERYAALYESVLSKPQK